MLPVWNTLFNALVITAFVAMMMVAVEYINVLSRGIYMDTLVERPWRAYLVGALLGIMPGCLGSFAMVTLYAHRRVTLGALVTTMIATSGDEAFVMLSLFPKTAIALFAGLAALGMAAGWMTDHLFMKRHRTTRLLQCNFEHHPQIEQAIVGWREVAGLWRNPMPIRTVLTFSIALFLVLLVGSNAGLIGSPGARKDHHHRQDIMRVETNHSDAPRHPHPNEADYESSVFSHHDSPHIHGTSGWTFYTLMGLLLFGLFVVSTVCDHFLEHHLYDHVLKSHVPRIFFWTLLALGAMEGINHVLDLHQLVAQNLTVVLLIAVAIGVIPESGPHLIFVTLFATGNLPISILVASSIVQDGHGMVPLLAHSRRDFAMVKLINAAFGLSMGALLLTLNL